VYATFEYPGGITGTFTSGESNAFEERYEAFYGTKGTLIIRNEDEAMLFDEGDGAAKGATAIEVAPKGPGALLETSETKPQQAGGSAAPKTTATQASAAAGGAKAISPSTYEINAFCSAIRCDTPLNGGPEKATHSASWTIAANEALKSGTIVKII
jgi:predicted dehydrogenase